MHCIFFFSLFVVAGPHCPTGHSIFHILSDDIIILHSYLYWRGWQKLPHTNFPSLDTWFPPYSLAFNKTFIKLIYFIFFSSIFDDSHRFRDNGIPVIDADLIARQGIYTTFYWVIDEYVNVCMCWREWHAYFAYAVLNLIQFSSICIQLIFANWIFSFLAYVLFPSHNRHISVWTSIIFVCVRCIWKVIDIGTPAYKRIKAEFGMYGATHWHIYVYIYVNFVFIFFWSQRDILSTTNCNLRIYSVFMLTVIIYFYIIYKYSYIV